MCIVVIGQNGLLRHRGTKRCLELSQDGSQLLMSECSSNSERQIWIWKRNKSSAGQLPDQETAIEDNNYDVDKQQRPKVVASAVVRSKHLNARKRTVELQDQDIAADVY